ncbi:MAG TPA: peptide deformylase, partial [Candidatus Paceibacterota bacterium]
MREIVQDGNKVLREIAKPVPDNLFGSTELSRLIKDMSEALDRYPEGVALAAPQIGVSYRLFIVRTDRTVNGKQPTANKPDVQVYINPEIVKTSRKKAKADEGCLSVHGVYGTTKRHERVTIKARRSDGSHIQR